MSVQTFYAVKDTEGKFLRLTFHHEAGDLFSSWGNLSDATYFETKASALESAIQEEIGTEIETTICQLEVMMKAEEKTAHVSQQLHQEKQADIMKRVMEKVPVTKEELLEVFDLVMEGSGMIVGAKEINGQKISILFQETGTDEWLIKRKGIEL